MPIDINVRWVGYFVILSLLFPILAFFLLRRSREKPVKDAFIILLLSVIPPLQLVALLVFYSIPNKQPEHECSAKQ
ncbi:hypothetical protein PSECIP111951_01494 [Pseudoalteromonas holothuriae]|uniref:Uncharacterized protein n=1 Tax=Pseudoalteromonas holothuriae TaxID=2963714 RepID=A0A9W4R1K4_9GAMM|nr:hypothetical protein PSECIP111951_01494 [Pseudoalteromonas sp. CIP111951]CAH9063060.1 hypothetical protein PSECIP111854_03149 [Pseudoalteromonas sp. CIP111854]